MSSMQLKDKAGGSLHCIGVASDHLYHGTYVVNYILNFNLIDETYHGHPDQFLIFGYECTDTLVIRR